MRFSSLFPFVVGAALIPHAYAWGAVGHEIVATIAQMHLHPSVMPKLCDILQYPIDECHLAPVSAWADRVRNQAKYRWTGPLHYIGAEDDYPSATCAFPGPNGWKGRTHINVLNAVRNTTHVLQEYVALRRSEVQTEPAPSYVQDGLKFLIHFVGDMHMPLHLTSRARGGNDDKVSFEGRTTNLHSVWDSRLISERIRTLPRNYTLPLPLPDVELFLRDTIYDPYIRRLVWEGLLDKWQDELDTWLDCPPSSSSNQRQRQRQLEPTSTWQHVLSFLSSAAKPKGEDNQGSDDGGLGIDDDTLCPYAWAKPIHQLNCQIVYPKLDEAPLASFGRSLSRLFNPRASSGREHAHSDEECGHGGETSEDTFDAFTVRKSKKRYLELYTPDYVGLIKEKWIVEKLLTQAGIRLAAVLNWIFVEPEEDQISSHYLTL